MDQETKKYCLMGCGGFWGLGLFIGFIILMCSIHTLGPEEQVVIEGPDGKYVVNGPGKKVLSPSRKKDWREAIRLGPHEYCVVKDSLQGLIRHESGPMLLWLKAYDVNPTVKRKIVLQLQEYTRLVNLEGAQRVVVGPEILVPVPLETSPNGTESAIVIQEDTTVLVENKTSGRLKLVSRQGVFTPEPYEYVVEIRKATLLTRKEYALVKNKTDVTFRHEEGPQLLKIDAYDQLMKLEKKIVLQKDQYCVLKDDKTGKKRVEKGPATFVPNPSEKLEGGVRKAAFIDTDTAVLVLTVTTGQQRLVTQNGAFFPAADERILEERSLIRVLPHEAVVVRDAQGRVTIYNGAEGTAAFFLPPYTSVVTMQWSDFSHIPSPGVEQVVTKAPVTKIDLRTRKMFFSYEVPTSDNVKLRLYGTIFWKIFSVGRMMNTTSDPEGDVWHHSRSALIQSVSKITLQNFMSSFSNITAEAMKIQESDGFYAIRGTDIESMELTSFETVDASTSQILQQIITETINRINRLQVQESTNEVRAATLAADIMLEKQRTALITTKAENSRLEAEMAGDAVGEEKVHAANTFIGGLNESVPDVDQRIKLYEMHNNLDAKNRDTHNLAAGNAKMFLTAQDIKLSGSSSPNR
jgi:regulator of protease activity HflC (stomatin/prohibitin superfamily)